VVVGVGAEAGVGVVEVGDPAVGVLVVGGRLVEAAGAVSGALISPLHLMNIHVGVDWPMALDEYLFRCYWPSALDEYLCRCCLAFCTQ